MVCALAQRHGQIAEQAQLIAGLTEADVVLLRETKPVDWTDAGPPPATLARARLAAGPGTPGLVHPPRHRQPVRAVPVGDPHAGGHHRF